jgi:endonuclease-3 related protein
MAAGPQPPARPAYALRQAYRLLRRRFGHQHWWPGDTPFEICVGAILTQNTNWTNVERALNHLKAADLLDPRSLFAVPEAELAQLLRPAGYFNVKTRRLRAFLKVLVEDFDGRVDGLLAGPTNVVRNRLLAISGIGPETADSMLLYAGGHSSFVIDAYTTRIFTRHGWAREEASYDELQALCQRILVDRKPSARLDYWGDYHAQLVRVGKEFCRPTNPRCTTCPLSELLPQGARRQPG